MPSQVCASSSARLCLINHSVRHLQHRVGVNQAGLGTSTLPWAAHVGGKGFSAAERRMLIYLLATSSSLCPPFLVSWCRLTKRQKVASDSFPGSYCGQKKKVSVTVFCSPRINDAVLSLLVTTKQSAASSPVFLRSPVIMNGETKPSSCQQFWALNNPNSKILRLLGRTHISHW